MKETLVSLPIEPETFKRLERHIKNRLDVRDVTGFIESAITAWEWDKFHVYGEKIEDE